MTFRPSRTWIVMPLVAPLLFGGCRPSASPQTPSTPAVAQQDPGPLLAQFNRGAALMEQYEYTDAARAFEKVVQEAPEWTAAKFNLGLAYLNRHEEKGAADWLDRARQIFQSILAEDPNHRHARFCLGMYHQHRGQMEEALKCFQAVRRADPDDLYVAYKCAEVLISLGRHDEATPLLEEIATRDPGFTSGIYRLAMQYRRTGENEKAMAQLKRFQELTRVKLDKGFFQVDKAYGAAGKYYTILDASALPVSGRPATPSPRILLAPDPRTLEVELRPWQLEQAAVQLPGIAVGDIDGDGDLDVCLTCAGDRGQAMLWINDGQGNFSPGQTLADYATAPCFGDVDNDGDLDLWLGRAGADQLWENDGKGKFSAVELTGVDQPAALTTCARLADVDSDGDLDLLAAQAAAGTIPVGPDTKLEAASVYNNNRDGSFEDITEKLGLALDQTPLAVMVYDDFDGDRDLDLLLLAAGEADSAAWVNFRAWRSEVRSGKDLGLAVRNVVGATTADPDKDGDRDLLVFSRDGLALLVNQGDFTFQVDEVFG
ncbi:MAG TPA: tetratricopeptide repeat protein, partial [Planctomycetaceae bacterium]|nr:tetratricopeptide repeat protein [Planctomycetaceae bacterium]